MTTASLDRNKTLGLTLAGVLVTVYLLAPFSWLVLTSVMHERDALSVPPQWIPKDATLENYRIFFDPSGTRAIVGSRAAAQMLPGMLNSLIAALGTAILNLVLGTLAAYSLARFEFRGRTTLLLLYLGSRSGFGQVHHRNQLSKSGNGSSKVLHGFCACLNRIVGSPFLDRLTLGSPD
jgi:multiple sugar transport system permease protein